MRLGRLEPVDIRGQWAKEEGDFTPWLAKDENLQVLSEAIDLDLEVEGTEVSIGSYKADIVARDPEGRVVIVENQLEKTDHRHLGQLLTYASGLGAKIVIWVSQEVTDEHRQAIDWLNDVTTSDVAFFACEIELWRIGESTAAPRFKVVSSPNDWSKSVLSGSKGQTLSPTKSAHLEFWNAFKSFMEEDGAELRLRTPRAQHWYAIAVGRSRFNISLTTNTQTQRVGCEIYIRGKDAKLAFSQLNAEREEIESSLGPLDWQELPEGQDCRIIVYRDGNSKHRGQWPELHGWLKEKAEAFYVEFRPRIRRLRLGDEDAA